LLFKGYLFVFRIVGTKLIFSVTGLVTFMDKSKYSKFPTGIKGIDLALRGGLPRGRTTLISGTPGSGKTILGLQTLVNGCRADNENGLFVCFEEPSHRIISNAASFEWEMEKWVESEALNFLDARPTFELTPSGSYNIAGLLGAIQAEVRDKKASRVVFDSFDSLMELLEGLSDEKREFARLLSWIDESEISVLITVKKPLSPAPSAAHGRMEYFQYLSDCIIHLNRESRHGFYQRNLNISKYRGSFCAECLLPFLIDEKGMQVAYHSSRFTGGNRREPSRERLSSGIADLDRMIEGGFLKNTSMLVTGSPGTAKSSLAGSFVEASCRAGERCLMLVFDDSIEQTVFNLESIQINLRPFLEEGSLHMLAADKSGESPETQYLRLLAAAETHESTCVVIDPVSAMTPAHEPVVALNIVNRLVDWARNTSITLFCTSLLDSNLYGLEVGTPIEISTLADTWIHLNYQLYAGERNRGITIIKSRGTSHSNQMRELILEDSGIRLSDVFTSGGEVLMGTLRWEAEEEKRQREADEDACIKQEKKRLKEEEQELAHKRAQLDSESDELRTQILALEARKKRIQSSRIHRQKSIEELRSGRKEDAGETEE